MGGYAYGLIYGTNSLDWWLKKFDSSGSEDLNWDMNFSYNSSDVGSDHLRSLAVSSDDKIYVGGDGAYSTTYQPDWWLKKFNNDSTEDVSWNKTVNDLREEIYAVAVDSQGNVYVGGFGTNLINSTSSWDWWLKRYDADGTENITWNLSYGSGSGDQIVDIVIDNHDNVYVLGLMPGTWDTSSGDWLLKKFYSNGSEDLSWNLSGDEKGYGGVR